MKMKEVVHNTVFMMGKLVKEQILFFDAVIAEFTIHNISLNHIGPEYLAIKPPGIIHL
jgi:hypothetical protein